MASPAVQQLRARSDAAWAGLTRQLQGMEPHLERSDAPGEWTTRQVLAHLLLDPRGTVTDRLRTFAERQPPLLDVNPGQVVVTPERQRMTLRQFLDALDGQRREVFAYLDGLPEADLERRKVRIPAFAQFLGSEEVSLGTFVGIMFDRHWTGHAGQLGKIRKAVGLPEAGA